MSKNSSLLDQSGMQPFYTHQVIEFPEVGLDVTHCMLHKGKCPKCGRHAKAALPETVRSGYGPRLCALITEMSEVQGASRETVQEFIKSVFGFSISIGAIQKVRDRASEAFKCARFGVGICVGLLCKISKNCLKSAKIENPGFSLNQIPAMK